LFPLFATGVIYNSGKFAASVIDTGGNLPLASLTQVANLPAVLLTNLPTVSTTLAKLALISVVHLDLRENF
jgi:hypothetical protein